jgi:putative ABC transport system permease protein
VNPVVLTRLVGTELRGRRLRAMLLLLLVVALSSAALVAGLETQDRAGSLWDDAFDEANGAHVVVSSEDDAVLTEVVRDQRVAQASDVYRVLGDGVELRSREQDDAILVREVGRDALPSVGRPLLRDGRWVAPGASDELVLDRAYAIDRGIEVGDRVDVTQAGRDTSFVVVGRAVDLVDCLFPQCDPSPAWVDPAGFERFDTGHAFGAVFLRLDDPDAASEFAAGVEVRFGERAGTDEWLDTREDALTVSGFFGAFLSGLGVFVMVAAALVVLGSMASRIVARRRDIGLLKAVGVTPRQVAASSLAAHALVAAFGVVLGWLAGSVLAGRLQLNVGEVLGAEGASFPISRLVVAFVVIEVIVVGAVLVPSWRAGRLPTTAALAPVGVARSRRSPVARAAERMGAGPVATAGLRDAFARPARSVFTVLALAIAVVSVVVSLGFNRTIDNAFDDPAATGDPFDLVASPLRSDRDASAIAGALDANPDVTTWFTATERTGVIGGDAYLARALGGDVEGAGYQVEGGRLPRADDEAIAGYGLLQAIDAGVGDTVDVDFGGRTVPLRIVGWYADIEDGGEVLMVPLRTLEAVEPDVAAGAYFAHVRPGADVDAVATSLQQELRGAAQVAAHDIDGDDEVNAFRTMFWLVSALVVLVAFANLASTLLLAVRERAREFGVLRSVGFTPRQVLGVSAVGAGALGVVATVIGIPIGWAAFRYISTAVGRGIGVGPNFGVDPGLVAIGVLIPLSIAVAVLLGVAVTRRTATVEVSDLVRYE